MNHPQRQSVGPLRATALPGQDPPCWRLLGLPWAPPLLFHSSLPTGSTTSQTTGDTGPSGEHSRLPCDPRPPPTCAPLALAPVIRMLPALTSKPGSQASLPCSFWEPQFSIEKSTLSSSASCLDSPLDLLASCLFPSTNYTCVVQPGPLLCPLPGPLGDITLLKPSLLSLPSGFSELQPHLLLLLPP